MQRQGLCTCAAPCMHIACSSVAPLRPCHIGTSISCHWYESEYRKGEEYRKRDDVTASTAPNSESHRLPHPCSLNNKTCNNRKRLHSFTSPHEKPLFWPFFSVTLVTRVSRCLVHHWTSIGHVTFSLLVTFLLCHSLYNVTEIHCSWSCIIIMRGDVKGETSSERRGGGAHMMVECCCAGSR